MAKKPTPTTTDDVMQLTRGEQPTYFNYEEWVFARLLWLCTGQRLGALARLYDYEVGSLDETEIDQLAAMLAVAAERKLGERMLEANTASAAPAELFELVKTVWRLPYRKVTDSTDRVWIGTKMIGNFGDPGVPPVPTWAAVPAFRTALAKLTHLTTGTGPLAFKVVGKRFLAQRR